MVWYSHLFQNFPQFIGIHTVKGFGIINRAEVDVFLELSCFFHGLITHLEPDILEHEVKWSLGSITMNKASGGDGIPAELFQILEDDAVIVMHSICQQIWKAQYWPQAWERSAFISIPKKGNAKESSNYHATVLISHAGKVVLKILQTRLQRM